MQESHSASYAAAGVDVTAGYESVERIKPLVKSTFREGVLGGLGGFGGLFEPKLAGMKRPVTVSGTDGVGTKLKIAFLTGKHDTVGIDCVAMCVNDIICAGAEPLFFLDCLTVGKNVPARTAEIVSGVAEGCRQAHCALIGGETAEHPGMMPEDEYDLVGFSVGLADYDKMLDNTKIAPGDALIALPSTGLHSNGFSLVRSVFKPTARSLAEYIPELGKTLGEELLTPTRIYVRPVLALLEKFGAGIRGAAHITGGGLYENVPRCLPDGIRARIDAKKFPEKPIFKLLAEKGKIPARDMYNTYNMGVGLILAVEERLAGEIMETLRGAGETPAAVGYCDKGEKGVELTW
ncbi:MAG: phosphoribosylformylglycinamidine cyclo-ligase [Oscillospiraceae bacterium]|jgi:phosphoribosylformylglycinamidine cyclo-ligase|nr:phosphoribosylformylglycinamidine cyclo-ligase [Oscillospiraceae bacterium]